MLSGPTNFGKHAHVKWRQRSGNNRDVLFAKQDDFSATSQRPISPNLATTRKSISALFAIPAYALQRDTVHSTL